MLAGEGPADLRENTLLLGADLVLAAGLETSPKEARRRLNAALADGRALEIFAKLIAAQGGDATVCDDVKRLPQPVSRRDVPAPGGRRRDADRDAGGRPPRDRARLRPREEGRRDRPGLGLPREEEARRRRREGRAAPRRRARADREAEGRTSSTASRRASRSRPRGRPSSPCRSSSGRSDGRGPPALRLSSPAVLYRLENVRKSFGTKDVLVDATWQHDPGRIVGLVGRNGAGKSTVLKIVQGTVESDGGKRYLAGGTTFASLDQAVEPEGDEPLRAFVARAQEPLLELERTMRRLEEAIASHGAAGDADELQELLHEHDGTRERFERAGGYEADSRIDRVLEGVGLARALWDRPVGDLSGGQKHRAQIARLLLTDASVLLLDEPTNHLDVSGMEFLEGWLVERKTSVNLSALVVSHDRRFLERRRGPHRGGRERQARGLPGRLRDVPQAEGRARPRAREGGREAAADDRAHGGVHPPEHRGAEDEAGAGAAQDARADRAPRGAERGRERRHDPLRGGADLGRPRPRGEEDRPGLREHRTLDAAGFVRPAPRGPDGALGSERLRQDDAPEEPRAGPAAALGVGSAGRRCPRRLLRPGDGGPSAGRDRARRRDGSRPLDEGGRGARLPRALRLPGRRRLPEDRDALRRREGAPLSRAHRLRRRELPPPRRADEPPRPRRPRSSRGRAPGVRGRDRLRVPRPLVRRPHRDADPRDRAGGRGRAPRRQLLGDGPEKERERERAGRREDFFEG